MFFTAYRSLALKESYIYCSVLMLFLTYYLILKLALPGHLAFGFLPPYLFFPPATVIFLALVLAVVLPTLAFAIPDKIQMKARDQVRVTLIFIALVYLFESFARFELVNSATGPRIVLEGKHAFTPQGELYSYPVEIGGIQLTTPLVVISFLAGLVLLAIFIYLLYRPPRTRTLVVIFFIVGILVRLAWIKVSPLTPMRSGQFSQIIWASNDFLAGRSPYHMHDFGVHKQNFSYLPGTWLIYVPLVWAGRDPRYLNVVLSGLTFLLISWVAVRHLQLQESRKSAVSLLLSSLFLLPVLIGHDANTQFQSFQLWMVLCFCLLKFNRYALAAIVYGIALATNHFAVLFAPLLLIFLLRRKSLRDALWLVFLTASVAAAFILPFLLWFRESFMEFQLFTVRHNWQNLKWVEIGSECIGFTGLFRTLGLTPWLKVIQGGFLLALYLVACKVLRSLVTLVGLSIMVYLSFLIFNALIEPHFYILVLWLIVLFLSFVSTAEDRRDDFYQESLVYG